MSELLTLDEVADRTRTGKRTVERWVSTGELRSVKLGRRRLVPDDALEQFIRTALRRGRVA